MTARSLELIARADVILYDRLIPDGALAGAREDALLLDVGKVGGGEQVPQEATIRGGGRRSQLRRPAYSRDHDGNRAAARRRAGGRRRQPRDRPGGAGDRRRHVGFRLARRAGPRHRRRRPRAGPCSGDDTGAAERRAHRAGRRAGVLRRQLGVGLPRSTRSRSPRRTRSRCSASTPAGCWPPTASTTSRPDCTRSRSRRSTPTRSARRSPSSGCG